MDGSGPSGEGERLRALRRYDVLDTPPEPAFDRITRLASSLLGTPIALVSLVDDHRQWFKSKQGLDANETPREIAFCTHAIEQHDIMVVPDALADPRFAENPLVKGDPKIRFYAGAPLQTSDGFNLGTLCVIDREPRDLSDEQRSLLSDLASVVVDELELRRQNHQASEELEEKYLQELELKRLAWTDFLTGVYNRRYLMEMGEKEFSRAKRYDRPLALMMIDIDRFKKINDLFGHPIGDSVLVTLAGLCREMLREQDYFGRLGGEEFLGILPETTLEDAVRAAERLRAEVSKARIQVDGQEISTTISVGVATVGGEDANLSICLKKADDALYEAKDAGRDKVIAFGSEPVA